MILVPSRLLMRGAGTGLAGGTDKEADVAEGNE